MWQDKHCIRILALSRQDARFGTYANNADPVQTYFENGVLYANNADPVTTYFENGVLLKLVLGGMADGAHFSTGHEKTQYNGVR